MAAHKIIFVSQEISPYLPATDNARWGHSLPQSIQQRKYEVRTFMPDFGTINERRNQLHEVIRLSGMNISIGESDHPLVVKVASMQPSRIQVYFIDNEDYFQKLASDSDVFGTNRADNDERIIFFARGTMETARKLRWEPSLMEVSGWFSALIPLYLRNIFNDGISFRDTKLVYTVLPEDKRIDGISDALFAKLEAEGVDAAVLEKYKSMPLTHDLLHKMAIDHADAVVFEMETPDAALVEYCEAQGKEWKHFTGDGDHADDYDALYKKLMSPDED